MDFNLEVERHLLDSEPIHYLKSFARVAPMQVKPKPYVKIVEQPAEKSLRFRYSTEGKLAGSIRGVKSTPSRRSYPTIQVIGYRGKARVEVSCVLINPSKSGIYKQHPHKLVGRDGCENGVCRLPITEKTMRLTFENLGIHRVKRNEINKSLRLRKDMKVDPFKAGFFHGDEIHSNDLKAVRLCFQVYLEEDGIQIPLKPVVSDPILNRRTSGPVIVKLSHCVAPATGSEHDILMFCEKIDKADVKIRFYKEGKNMVVWESLGLFNDPDIHREFGISFRAPCYSDVNITEPVKVFIQLIQPSDGSSSEGLPFQYLPIPAISVPRIKIGSKRGSCNKKQLDGILNLHSSNGIHPNIPLLTQPSCSSNKALKTIPSFDQSWIEMEHSKGMLHSKIKVNHCNLMDSIPKEKSNCAKIPLALETLSTPLPSFRETWKAMDYSNGFPNTNLDTSCHRKNKIRYLNLMESIAMEESEIVNKDILASNNCAKVPLNPLETTSETLPSLRQTWKAMDQSNEFLNSTNLDTFSHAKTNVNHLDFMDLVINEESEILNQDSFAKIPFSNSSISSNDEIPPDEIVKDGGLVDFLRMLQ